MTLGEPEQPLFLTYYTLKEALNYQNPKVVLFDIQSLFYSEQFIKEKFLSDERHYIHFSLDGMRNIKIKKMALEEAKKYKTDLNVWDYYIDMHYNHSNWQDLTKDNFVRSRKSDYIWKLDVFNYARKYRKNSFSKGNRKYWWYRNDIGK